MKQLLTRHFFQLFSQASFYQVSLLASASFLIRFSFRDNYKLLNRRVKGLTKMKSTHLISHRLFKYFPILNLTQSPVRELMTLFVVVSPSCICVEVKFSQSIFKIWGINLVNLIYIKMIKSKKNVEMQLMNQDFIKIII